MIFAPLLQVEDTTTTLKVLLYTSKKAFVCFGLLLAFRALLILKTKIGVNDEIIRIDGNRYCGSS